MLKKNMNATPSAHHFRLTLATVILALSCLAAARVLPAKAETPQPVHRGKEPLDSVGPTLELIGEDEHSSLAAELQGRLMVALGDDDLDEVRRLLLAGAEINRPLSESGQTPVMAAESLAMATLLCDRGAQVQARDSEGGTVLHYAVSRSAALDLMPYFVSHGADINARGWDNQTPLFAAVSYFNERDRSASVEVWTGAEAGPGEAGNGAPSAGEVITLLIELGADINAVDDYGSTMLMQCTVADDEELVTALLQLGADTTIRDSGGATARDIAYELGHRYIYQLLDQ